MTVNPLYLVLSHNMGLAINWIADLPWLKIIIGLLTGTFSYVNSSSNQVISAIVWGQTIVLFFSWTSKIMCCFFDFKDIKNQPNCTTYPVIDLLLLGQASQSTSHQQIKFVLAWAFSQMPWPTVPFKHLTIGMW